MLPVVYTPGVIYVNKIWACSVNIQAMFHTHIIYLTLLFVHPTDHLAHKRRFIATMSAFFAASYINATDYFSVICSEIHEKTSL